MDDSYWASQRWLLLAPCLRYSVWAICYALLNDVRKSRFLVKQLWFNIIACGSSSNELYCMIATNRRCNTERRSRSRTASRESQCHPGRGNSCSFHSMREELALPAHHTPPTALQETRGCIPFAAACQRSSWLRSTAPKAQTAAGGGCKVLLRHSRHHVLLKEGLWEEDPEDVVDEEKNENDGNDLDVLNTDNRERTNREGNSNHVVEERACVVDPQEGDDDAMQMNRNRSDMRDNDGNESHDSRLHPDCVIKE